MRNGRTYLTSMTMLALLGIAAPAVGQSQHQALQISQSPGVRCQCERWTCPDCQQQQLCEPYASGQITPQLALPGTVFGSPAHPATPGSAGSGNAPLADSGRSPSDMATSPELFNLSDDAVRDPSLSAPDAGPSSTDLFAANLGRGSEGAFGSSLLGATTPEMMGDFFGPGGSPSVFSREYQQFTIPVPSAGYALGRMKLAENSSPIPRDRIFFNYSHFTGVPLSSQPISVNRYSPGFEKTFLDELCSFELRTPFGSSLDNDILANGLTSDNEFQFGNLFLSLKGVLIQKENWLLTAGSSFLLPTAADSRVIDPLTRQEFLRFENKSTHIMPFIGGAFIPSERLFAQWMVQCDIDANGNPVIATEGLQRTKIGTLQDFTLLYTDLSIGYWLYQANGSQRRMVTGIAPVAELHYNRALTTADSVSDANNQVNQVVTDFDNVNVQVGVTFNIRNNSRLGIGYATPLGNSFDRVFDKEFRLTLNRYF